MEKSNIKKLKEHLREILAKEEYKEKKFFVYDNYFDSKGASQSANFKYSNFVKNLPLTGSAKNTEDIIDLVCNYVSNWEFETVGTFKNMVIVDFTNNHKIEIIKSDSTNDHKIGII